jgi:D-3-phosphoglycerate dehydrogenase
MADKILVTLSTFAEYDAAPLHLIEASGVPFSVHKSGKRITTAELVDQGRDATVVIAGVEPYDARTIEQLPALRCISRCGAGVDAVDLAAARARGVTVLNTPDVPTEAVAELAVTMLLAIARNLSRQTGLMRRREWGRIEAHLLQGRRVGLIGLGRIGRRVVELLAPFRPVMLAADPLADRAWAEAHGVMLVSLDELLATSDLVSIHAARRSEAPLRIGAAEIARMKNGAGLVNLARGGMVDEDALHDALASGHLAGAGLDVYGEEPYRGRLCDLDTALLTPHNATLTVETRVAMETEAVDKALRFLRGALRPGEAIV